MTAFAVFGYAVFLWLCGVFGWHLGLFLDVRCGVVTLTAPITNEIDELVVLAAMLTKGTTHEH